MPPVKPQSTRRLLCVDATDLRPGDTIVHRIGEYFDIDRPFTPLPVGTLIKARVGKGTFFHTDRGWINLSGSDAMTSSEWFFDAVERNDFTVLYTPKED